MLAYCLGLNLNQFGNVESRNVSRRREAMALDRDDPSNVVVVVVHYSLVGSPRIME